MSRTMIDLWIKNVIKICTEDYGTCPFGCGKDGGPNCRQNIRDVACAPSKTIDREWTEFD